MSAPPLSVPWPSQANVYVMTPPYRSLAAAAHAAQGQPEVGTILCADGRGSAPDALAGTATLVVRRHQWPWIVPCLFQSSRPALLEHLIDCIPDWSHVLARDDLPVGVPLRPERVLRAVDARPVPPPTVLARFVALRLRSDELGGLLAEQFAAVVSSTPSSCRSSSYYSRRLARLSRWNARDWRIVARMALRAAGWSGTDTTNPRTWHTRARRYLGCSWETARHLRGWESVLELAIRVHGPRS